MNMAAETIAGIRTPSPFALGALVPAQDLAVAADHAAVEIPWKEYAQSAIEPYRSIIRNALACKTRDEFRAYWSPETFGDFWTAREDLVSFLRVSRLAGKLPPPGKRVPSHKRIAEIDPEAENEAHFCVTSADGALARARHLMQMEIDGVVASDEAADALAAKRFHGALLLLDAALGCFYAMTAPKAIRVPRAPDDIIAELFSMLRAGALEMVDATMTSLELRRPDEEPVVVDGDDKPATDPFVIPDGDLIDIEKSLRRIEAGAA